MLKKTSQERVTQPLFRHLLMGIGGVLIFFAITFEVVLLQHFHRHVTDDARKSIADLSLGMQAILHQQALGMSMVLQTVLHDTQTQHDIKAYDADALKTHWQPLFKHLQRTHRITHFTFFDTTRSVLVRLHRDERQDTVDRYSLLEAQRSQKMAWGIEIGSFGMLVLRTVHPVFEEGVLVGYVEIGKPIEDIFRLLHVNLSSHFAVLIDKVHIQKKMWEEYASVYKERFRWDKFEKSVAVFVSRKAFPYAMHLDTIDDELAYNEMVFDGKTWVMYKKALHDSSGNRIGDILVMHDITLDKEAFIRFSLLSSLIGIVLLLFIMGIIYALLVRTEKKIRYEEAKRQESEEKMQELGVQSRTVFWEVDHRGIFTYVSDIIISLSGYRLEEIVGKMNFLDMYSKQESQGFEDRARWVFDRRESFINKEDKLLSKTGKPVWVLTNAIPLFNASKEFLGYRGISTDITKRKMAEEAQKEAHERIQKIASRIPGVVYQYKVMPDGRSCFPYASAAIYDIYRVTPEEVRYDASKVFDVLHPDDREGIIASIQKSAQTLTPWRHEYRVKFDDEVRWLYGNALPELQVDGSTLWHGFIDDITERKFMEEELKALNEALDQRVEEEIAARLRVEKEQEAERQFLVQKAKLSSMGEMMGAIAHQWRQPLNALYLNIQNLDDDFDEGKIDRSFLRQFIVKNKKTILFMSKTIDDFRNFFKIDKEKQTFSIKESIVETLSLQSAQFRSHNIDVEVVGEDVSFFSYKGEFQQVILNLLNNAKDAIIERNIELGKITITLDPTGITLEDNAGGIDSSIIERIFEPYFTTKEQGEGTGIGLYMSKMIIEKNMGGVLRVENTDVGARFIITFAHESSKSSPKVV